MLDSGTAWATSMVEGNVGSVLLGRPSPPTGPAFQIRPAASSSDLAAYRRLRAEVFVEEQGLFNHSDTDDRDDDPRTVVLLAVGPDTQVLGGVRLAPAWDGPDLGWWNGSRLVVDRAARRAGGVGPALIRAACAYAEQAGVIRFEATVQAANERLFGRLGWQRLGSVIVAGTPHVHMRWPITRFADQARTTKRALGELLTGLHLGGAGFRGDDGAPVPESDLIAACDAIVPAMVERDPEWAGWCGVLVNANDLSAMGARPVGLLDAVAARDSSFAARMISGLRQASQAYRIPVLGGHTQLGVPAALSVTALGLTANPVPAGGGRPGHQLRLTADLGGGWRRGYTGRQWDSTTSRNTIELQIMARFVAETRPAAAKDVSMAGMVGTLGMLAEASGCAATLDLAAVPRPANAGMAEWLSCFPGFGMLSTDEPGAPIAPTGPATSTVCGELSAGHGVILRWPDGLTTDGVPADITGLGPATGVNPIEECA